jgi:hypothetical protein
MEGGYHEVQFSGVNMDGEAMGPFGFHVAGDFTGEAGLDQEQILVDGVKWGVKWGMRRQPKAISFFLVLALIACAAYSALAATPWWNSAWGYRVRLDVDPGGYERYQKLVVRAMNLTSLFAAVGTTGALNENSLRVIEVDGGGNVIDSTVVFQFDKDPVHLDFLHLWSGNRVQLNMRWDSTSNEHQSIPRSLCRNGHFMRRMRH